jgi:hypothetical protein
VCNKLELAALTLMPYMISAAVAAITAIGITTVLPLLRIYRSIQPVQERLHHMAAGDLSSRIQSVRGSSQYCSIANDLNNVISELGHNIAQWKIINRNQWELLQSVRLVAVDLDDKQLLTYLDKMEENWAKIAEIEERLIT